MGNWTPSHKIMPEMVTNVIMASVYTIFASLVDILPKSKSRPLPALLPKSPYFTQKRCMCLSLLVSTLFTSHSSPRQCYLFVPSWCWFVPSLPTAHCGREGGEKVPMRYGSALIAKLEGNVPRYLRPSKFQMLISSFIMTKYPSCPNVHDIQMSMMSKCPWCGHTSHMWSHLSHLITLVTCVTLVT